jgi:hypothetical protein
MMGAAGRCDLSHIKGKIHRSVMLVLARQALPSLQAFLCQTSLVNQQPKPLSR